MEGVHIEALTIRWPRSRACIEATSSTLPRLPEGSQGVVADKESLSARAYVVVLE